MSYSKGVSWIGDTRIPFVDEKDKNNFNYNSEGINRQKTSEAIFTNIKIIGNHNIKDERQQGRFTPNLLVCDDMLNDGNIYKSSDNKWIGGKEKNWKGHINKRIYTYGDKGTNSRYYDLDLWFDKMIEKL